jgi:hypothetical protein
MVWHAMKGKWLEASCPGPIQVQSWHLSWQLVSWLRFELTTSQICVYSITARHLLTHLVPGHLIGLFPLNYNALNIKLINLFPLCRHSYSSNTRKNGQGILHAYKVCLGRPSHRWDDDIKVDHKEAGLEGVDSIRPAHDRNPRWALVNLKVPYYEGNFLSG